LYGLIGLVREETQKLTPWVTAPGDSDTHPSDATAWSYSQ